MGGGASWGNPFGGLPWQPTSPRQMHGSKVTLSPQTACPWWCLSSERWGAAEWHGWQNRGGPSRHSLPPAALCHYGGISAKRCDIHKVASTAEGCFVNILFSCLSNKGEDEEEEGKSKEKQKDPGMLKSLRLSHLKLANSRAEKFIP